MNEVLYISPSHSIEGEKQRMDYLFRRAIENNDLMDSVPVDIDIDPSDNSVLLNGTILGDYREILNVTSDGIFVQFDYGSDGKYRSVILVNKFAADLYSAPLGFVISVYEYTKGKSGVRECIYDSLN